MNPSLAKTTGPVLSVAPACEPLDEDRELCFADVNVKHGNASGLPVNLTGVRNGKSNGAELTVSVLGTLEFDLSKVDLSSLRLGDVQTLPPETPLTVLKSGKYQASIVDLNGDGILDLMLHFNLAAMVSNGDISETTTELCLYGEGPGYVLNGCGLEGGGGNGDEDDDEPDYMKLDDCPEDIFKKTGKTRCAMIRPYGRDAAVFVKAMEFGGFTLSTQIGLDANNVSPEWLTKNVEDLWGGSVLEGEPYWVRTIFRWGPVKLPLGDNGTCAITPSSQFELTGFRWGIREQVLVREDLDIPAEATNVRIQFLVDDLARIYINEVMVQRWTFSSEPDYIKGQLHFRCADYDETVTVPVTNAVSGKNRIGIWAQDSNGGSNFLDYRVFADVPIS